MDTNIILLVTSFSLCAIIAFAIYFALFQKSTEKRSAKTKKRDAIVVYGPQDSGKTTFVIRLLTNKVQTCFTSQLVNTASIQLNNEEKNNHATKNAYTFIDVPGAKVVRDTSQLHHAKVVLFMFDAFHFKAENVAVVLYEVLANKYIVENRIPIYILCNKADIMLTTKAHLMKKLESEVNRLWIARRSETMDSLVDESNEEVEMVPLLRSVDDKFSFNETCQNPVEFIEISVKTGKNLDKVKDIICNL